ncbi:MAG: thioredoxin family protein [Melioribacter sp.]|nr:thioredoxin family protein [Melioribacter sp.]
MPIEITTQLEFDEVIKSNIAAAFYMSTPDCNVCKVLKPKLVEFLTDKFPKIKFIYVNIAEAKELAAQKNVFTVPTILFYFDRKEYIRKARFVNFDELESDLERIYTLLE